MGLRCFALLERSVILFSIAVAAMIASPALRFEESVYSSIIKYHDNELLVVSPSLLLLI